MTRRPIVLANEAEGEARKAIVWYEACHRRVADLFEAQVLAALVPALPAASAGHRRRARRCQAAPRCQGDGFRQAPG
ncbi:hypothetical protein BE18_22950 [Sorangium cellulosum]|uniref:Uncharacterized protein n=1 Tax=Sorangium cellulosum TaxID=56 RepID=A0A150SA15_SORCE|nr:hypothetical protein BE18_22950 [Sorangium cellulosum]